MSASTDIEVGYTWGQLHQRFPLMMQRVTYRMLDYAANQRIGSGNHRLYTMADLRPVLLRALTRDALRLDARSCAARLEFLSEATWCPEDCTVEVEMPEFFLRLKVDPALMAEVAA